MRRATQYDLLIRGYSLDDIGTEAFTWYDLLVMVQFIQLNPASALAHEAHGARWTVESQLLAQVADTLALANWQRGGKKSAPRPKPIPRPWLKPKTQSLGHDAIPISDFNAWWDSAAPFKPVPTTPPAPKPKPPPRH